jgi:hypothetical protein
MIPQGRKPMHRIVVISGITALAAGLAVIMAFRGVLPDGVDLFDDIDWHGVHGIGA